MEMFYDPEKDILPDVNFKGQFNYTALHFAALHGNSQLIYFLLNKGCK